MLNLMPRYKKIKQKSPPKNTEHSKFIFKIPLCNAWIQITNINSSHCSEGAKEPPENSKSKQSVEIC